MISVEKTKTVPSTPAASNASTASTNGSRFAETLRSVQHRGRDLDPIFAKASATYGVPQELLRAIAFHESGFQTDAVSHAGAMGLMQLMPVAAQAMGVSDPFDPEQNVMGGAKLLGQYLEKYDGNLKLTLAAYGAGCGSVAKYDGIPPYKETQAFVSDIMSVVHAGGLPAWDHSGAPTAVFVGVQAPASAMPSAKAASASYAVKTMVTPAAVTATSSVAMQTPVKATVTLASGNAAAVSAATIAAAPMPESVVSSNASVKTQTSPISQSVTLPTTSTTAASVTAMRILTTVTPASAVVSAGLAVTTPASAVITAAELAAENLATLLAANASETKSQTDSAPAAPQADTSTATSADDAFRAALARGISNIGTGNLSSMQSAFFAQQPSSAAITELFQQIEAFDDFTEEDYRLLVTSLLADMSKEPAKDDTAPPFYLSM